MEGLRGGGSCCKGVGDMMGPDGKAWVLMAFLSVVGAATCIGVSYVVIMYLIRFAKEMMR